MCTLVLAWQAFADAPVAVAANRDESFDRPSRPPSVLDTDPRVVAPQDAEAGGTWLGYNEHGVVVGLTNRWIDTDRDGDRSRGLLVREALSHASAEAATRYVERELDERCYEGCNLVLADAAAALYVEWDGRVAVTNLDPGVHVVVNVGIDGACYEPAFDSDRGQRQAENARAVRDTLQPEPGDGVDAWLDRAAAVLADHDYGVCVHDDDYGTRSSSLLAVREDGTTYRFADGPPCETDYETVEGQF